MRMLQGIFSRYARRLRDNEVGVTIVENLVSIALIGIAVVGSIPMFATCFGSNASARSFAAVTNDVQDLLDSYRSMSYATLLAKFGANPTAITNNQTVTESSTSTDAKANYSVVFTAIRSVSSAIPEAVRVRVSIDQRRGKLGIHSLSYETIVANAA